MTPEQLMITRYKVIADYPFSNFKIGEVIELVPPKGMNTPVAVISKRVWFGKDFDYPYLFRKLEWWEERKLSDIPKYLLIRDEKRVIRVSKMRKEFGDGDIYVTFPGGHASIVHFLPSTEAQYLAQ